MERGEYGGRGGLREEGRIQGKGGYEVIVMNQGGGEGYERKGGTRLEGRSLEGGEEYGGRRGHMGEGRNAGGGEDTGRREDYEGRGVRRRAGRIWGKGSRRLQHFRRIPQYGSRAAPGHPKIPPGLPKILAMFCLLLRTLSFRPDPDLQDGCVWGGWEWLAPILPGMFRAQSKTQGAPRTPPQDLPGHLPLTPPGTP